MSAKSTDNIPKWALNLIPDLPPGPLDEYRKLASFDWKKLKLTLNTPEQLKIKYGVWNKMKADPLFARENQTPTMDEQKRLTAVRLKRINDLKYVPENVYDEEHATKVKYLMTFQDAIHWYDCGIAVKMGIGILAVENTLITFGTSRQSEFYEKIKNREEVGAMCLTEFSHGSNSKAVRTTATYDPKSQEFILNTPDFEAAKCWLGNVGIVSSLGLVFAQLYTDGNCYGLHAFIVPIRDPKTLLPYPGVIIGDMGDKVGLNGVDNGFLIFKNYRIKRENLLNTVSDVTPEGEHVTHFTDITLLNSATLSNFTVARLCLMRMSCNSLSAAVIISLRYAAIRKQFGENEDEQPILEYPLHQWRIFPYLASAVAFIFFTNKFADMFSDTMYNSMNNKQTENMNEIIAEIHSIVSGGKALLTWTAKHALSEAREACGGHGYLKCANIGQRIGDHEPLVTFEGDNNVLGQQASGWLLRLWDAKKQTKLPVASPLQTASFLDNAERILKTKFACRNVNEILDHSVIMNSYHWLICWLVGDTDKKLKDFLSKGMSKFQARSNIQVFRGSTISKVYSEYVVLKFYWDELKTVNESLKPVLYDLFYMYGLVCLERHLAMFYEGGYSTGPKMSQLVKDGIILLCAKIKPECIGLVDALAPPDFILNSVLGMSDGNLYKNLEKYIFSTPDVTERPHWWREIVFCNEKSKL